ncbi:mitogen [Ateline gammaherpesvirus 3]|uniref:Mitogen n=1 Tax=Ateline herpesvirus 3 TaxID=85618 RepID=Q9YTQ1_ATHV3|nr:mitogen [Ateline gammaherpesvirus 3]AAC95536.1 mitogen [Ateline gammaherpesvirus 3]
MDVATKLKTNLLYRISGPPPVWINLKLGVILLLTLCPVVLTTSEYLPTPATSSQNVTQPSSWNVTHTLEATIFSTSRPNISQTSENCTNCSTVLDLFWQQLGSGTSLKNLMLNLQLQEVIGLKWPKSSLPLANNVEAKAQKLQLPRNLPPTAVGPPNVKYKFGNRWWEPPKGANVNGKKIKFDDPPLPYTGAYNEDGIRMVNVNGTHVRYQDLPFMERLKRSGPPWCLRTAKEKIPLVKQLLKSAKKCCKNTEHEKKLQEELEELQKSLAKTS